MTRAMQKALRSRLSGIFLGMLLAISAALTGLDHKAPSPRDEAIAQAALAGYDVSDICAGKSGDLHAGNHCPACQQVCGATSQPPVMAPRAATLPIAAHGATVPSDTPLVRPVLDPAHGVRAPPLFG